MILKGKVAIITGAGQGIGKASALMFAGEGATVVCANRNEESGNQVVQEIKTVGGEAMFIRTDVTNEKDIINLINKTVEKYGRLDILFNNAGIEGDYNPTADYSVELFDKTMSVNCRGAFIATKYAIPQMLKNGGGSIINDSSQAGLVGYENMVAYTAAKHALCGLTKNVAIEYGAKGIRSNCVCPGPVLTEIVTGAAQRKSPDNPQLVYDAIASIIPSKHIAAPEEIASVVTFLASDLAKQVNGAIIPVDGGVVAV